MEEEVSMENLGQNPDDWLEKPPTAGDKEATIAYLKNCGREMVAFREKEDRLAFGEQARALRIVAGVMEVTNNWPDGVSFPNPKHTKDQLLEVMKKEAIRLLGGKMEEEIQELPEKTTEKDEEAEVKSGIAGEKGTELAEKETVSDELLTKVNNMKELEGHLSWGGYSRVYGELVLLVAHENHSEEEKGKLLKLLLAGDGPLRRELSNEFNREGEGQSRDKGYLFTSLNNLLTAMNFSKLPEIEVRNLVYDYYWGEEGVVTGVIRDRLYVAEEVTCFPESWTDLVGFAEEAKRKMKGALETNDGMTAVDYLRSGEDRRNKVFGQQAEEMFKLAKGIFVEKIPELPKTAEFGFLKLWETIVDIKDYDETEFGVLFDRLCEVNFGLDWSSGDDYRRSGDKAKYLFSKYIPDSVGRWHERAGMLTNSGILGKFMGTEEKARVLEVLAKTDSLWVDAEGKDNKGETIHIDLGCLREFDNNLSQELMSAFYDGYDGDYQLGRSDLLETAEKYHQLAKRDKLVRAEMEQLRVEDPKIDALVANPEMAGVISETRKKVKEILASFGGEKAAREAVSPELAAEVRRKAFMGQMERIYGVAAELYRKKNGLGVEIIAKEGRMMTKYLAERPGGMEERRGLMADLEFLRLHPVENWGALMIEGRAKDVWSSKKARFLLTELTPDLKNKFSLNTGDETTEAGDLVSNYKKLGEDLRTAADNSRITAIGEALAAFLESKTGLAISEGLKKSGKIEDKSSREKKEQEVLALLFDSEIEKDLVPVRQALRELFVLSVLAERKSFPFDSEVNLTVADSEMTFHEVYPPMLAFGSKDVIPYTLDEEPAIINIGGPNGAGKTQYLTALSAAESMGLVGAGVLGRVDLPADREGLAVLSIGAETTVKTSRFEDGVGRIKGDWSLLPEVTTWYFDEPLAGTGARWRGHLITALELAAAATGVRVRVNAHQGDVLYTDAAILGITKDLSEVGLSGKVDWRVVDLEHRIHEGRSAPFGIEMASGAGIPMVIAENAKKIRAGGAAIEFDPLPELKPESREAMEWANDETLKGIGFGYSQRGEGDVLGWILDGVKVKDYKDENLFRSAAIGAIKNPADGGWEKRAETVWNLGKSPEDLDVIWEIYRRALGNMQKALVGGESCFPRSDADGGEKRMREIKDNLLEAFRGGGHYYTYIKEGLYCFSVFEQGGGMKNLYDLIRGRRNIKDMLTEDVDWNEISRVSGESLNIEAEMKNMDEKLEEIRMNLSDNEKTKVVFEGMLLDQMRLALADCDSISKKTRSALGGTTPLRGDMGKVMGALAKIAEDKDNPDFGKTKGWEALFDGSWQKELEEVLNLVKKEESGIAEPADKLVRGVQTGDWEMLFELLTKLEDLADGDYDVYSRKFPVTMSLRYLHRSSENIGFLSEWEKAMKEDLVGSQQKIAKAVRGANLNVVLARAIRNESLGVCRTETSNDGRYQMTKVINPALVEAGIEAVSQTYEFKQGEVIPVTGINMGGKTSWARGAMIQAAGHKLAQIGFGEAAAMPRPEEIGGLYASINTAETKVGAGNLAAEAGKHGKFYYRWIKAGCPPILAVFDEPYTGTADMDQKALIASGGQAIVSHGGTFIVPTNEEGVIETLDKCGLPHRDVCFKQDDPNRKYKPQAGVGGPESFEVAGELGLDPRVVELAKILDAAGEKLKRG